MKKIILGFVEAIFLAGSAQLFAWGIGLQAGGAVELHGHGGLAVTFGLDKAPFIFAADLGFGGYGFSMAASADYWITNPKIMDWDWGAWKWHWGLGAAVGFTTGSGYGSFDIGPRALVGMNLEFLKNKLSWADRFETYVQLAYQPMIYFGTGFPDSLKWSLLSFPVVAGLRLWF